MSHSYKHVSESCSQGLLNQVSVSDDNPSRLYLERVQEERVKRLIY